MTTNGKHLKSAALRDFTVFHICSMSEADCVDFFAAKRWGADGAQICPHCGAIDRHYRRPCGLRRRCRHCMSEFSVFTHTVFQDRKMPYKKLLLGMKLFCDHAKGIAAHELIRQIDCQIKTATVMIGKLREAIYRARNLSHLGDLVHIDGGYFGGKPRSGRVRFKPKPENIATRVEEKFGPEKRKKRVTTPANWRRRMSRRVLIVIRQVSRNRGEGGIRTITAVCPAEVDAIAIPLAQAFIEPETEVMSDEAAAYNQFSARYVHKTVNHQVEYSTEDGVNENQAESYFARVRRNLLGITHRTVVKYLADLAAEMAWREDVRKMTEGEKLDELLKAIFSVGYSRWWRGYFQGHKRPAEITWEDEVRRAQHAA